MLCRYLIVVIVVIVGNVALALSMAPYPDFPWEFPPVFPGLFLFAKKKTAAGAQAQPQLETAGLAFAVASYWRDSAHPAPASPCWVTG